MDEVKKGRDIQGWQEPAVPEPAGPLTQLSRLGSENKVFKKYFCGAELSSAILF